MLSRGSCDRMEKTSREDMTQTIIKELKSQKTISNLKAFLEIKRRQSGKYGCILSTELDLFEALKLLQIDGIVFVTAETLESFRSSQIEGTQNIVIPMNFWEISHHGYLKDFLEENYVIYEFISVFLRDIKQINTINKLLKFFGQEESCLINDIEIEYENLSDLQRIMNTYRILYTKKVRIDCSNYFTKCWLENEIYQSISLLLHKKIAEISPVIRAIIQETYHPLIPETDNSTFLNPNFVAVSFFEEKDRFVRNLTAKIVSSLEGNELGMKDIKDMIIQKVQDEFGPFLLEEELDRHIEILGIEIHAILEMKLKDLLQEHEESVPMTKLKDLLQGYEESSLSRYLGYVFERSEFKKNIIPEIVESLKIAILKKNDTYKTELRQMMIISLYKQIFEKNLISLENLIYAAFFSFSNAAYYLIFSSKLDVKMKLDMFYFTENHYRIRNDFKRNLRVLRQAVEKGISPIYFYLLELEIMNKDYMIESIFLSDVWQLLDPSRKNILIIIDNLSFFDIQDQIHYEIKLLKSFVPTITPTCCSGILLNLNEDEYVTSKQYFHPLDGRRFEILEPLNKKDISKVDQFLKASAIQKHLRNIQIPSREFLDPVFFSNYQENTVNRLKSSVVSLFFSSFGRPILDDKAVNKSFKSAIERFIQNKSRILLVYFPEIEKTDHVEFKEFNDIDLRRHQEVVTQKKIMEILDLLKKYNLENFRIIITTDHGSLPLLYRCGKECRGKTEEFLGKIFCDSDIRVEELSSSVIDFNKTDSVYIVDERGLFIYSPCFQVLEELDSLLRKHADFEFDIQTTTFRIRDIFSLEKQTIKKNPISKVFMLFYPTKDWICLSKTEEGKKEKKIVLRTHGGASIFELVVPGVILDGNL